MCVCVEIRKKGVHYQKYSNFMNWKIKYISNKYACSSLNDYTL